MAKTKTTQKLKNSKRMFKKTNKSAQKQTLSAPALLRESLNFIYANKKILFGVYLVLFVVYLFMVRSGSTFDIDATGQLINDGIGGDGLFSKALLTGVLLGSGASAGTGASSLSLLTLLVLGSLAVIWAIRRLEAGKQFRVRDVYYSGMYPLIPFMLIILLISLQMIPFALGGFLYATAEVNGIVSTFIERAIFVSGWIALGLLSAYWLANSLMSIYAVTLPDIYPMQALRSTKKIVKGRRWSVILKVFVLAIFITITTGLILLFTVLTLPFLAVYVYDALFVFGLLFTHVYMFKLYRSLI